jgi:hypothetical protein
MWVSISEVDRTRATAATQARNIDLRIRAQIVQKRTTPIRILVNITISVDILNSPPGSCYVRIVCLLVKVL